MESDLLECSVASTAGDIRRSAWLVAPTSGACTDALLFLDGELYLQQVDALRQIAMLQVDGGLPNVLSCFVSNRDAAARHVDYLCNPAYALFIAKDVVNLMRSACPTLKRIVLCGLSLSGLQAAYTSLAHPEAFAATVCQSPSFWWENCRIVDHCRQASPSHRFWISVGSLETEVGVVHPPSNIRREMSQIAGCELATSALQQAGCEVVYRPYAGGHDPQCWQDELPLALRWAVMPQT